MNINNCIYHSGTVLSFHMLHSAWKSKFGIAARLGLKHLNVNNGVTVKMEY